MTHAFAIEPAAYQAFENEDELLERCKEWGLLSDKAVKAKEFTYKGHNQQLGCRVVGFVDPFTAVIAFDNEQKHCIHPAYLKEMQAGSFNSKSSSAAEETDTGRPSAPAQAPRQAPASVQERAASSAAKDSTGKAPAGAGNPAPSADPEPPAKAAKAAKPKSKKLDLPVEKVKMKAVVKEFATVPNHFTETDDEVIVYEPVSILEPDLDLGSAWSSHSNTLKKLELAVGDALSFEAKVIAKKLTKHPVPYKINNPSKIVKET